VCAVSRLILPAVLAGLVVGSLTNQPLAGWIVAGVVGGLLHLDARRRARSLGCPLPSRPPARQRPDGIGPGGEPDGPRRDEPAIP